MLRHRLKKSLANQAVGRRCSWRAGLPTPTPIFLNDHDLPPANRRCARGASIVVCPGGGYGALAVHEGQPVAEWLNTLGVTGVVLKYSPRPQIPPSRRTRRREPGGSNCSRKRRKVEPRSQASRCPGLLRRRASGFHDHDAFRRWRRQQLRSRRPHEQVALDLGNSHLPRRQF